MTTPQPLPAWLPPTCKGARTLPAGRWWDAVEVDGFTAMCVLGRLGPRSGPVVEDTIQGVARWLIPPGLAAGWELPGVRVLGRGHYLTVPPAEWCAGPWTGGPPIRWITPPRGTCLTGATELRTALGTTLIAPTRTDDRRA